ncbi:MAG: hypothetical protein KME12_03250 [Trichocoleus desertorum ATA4-8-CV12]|nr:hypothetical protein [Trichocoleus desertorum ATA4-8-CV12]
MACCLRLLRSPNFLKPLERSLSLLNHVARAIASAVLAITINIGYEHWQPQRVPICSQMRSLPRLPYS